MTCYQISEKGLELVKRISQKEKEATHEFVYAKGTRELLSVRSRRPAVLRCLHAIDATRFHQTRSWVVSFFISRPFGPSPRCSAQVVQFAAQVDALPHARVALPGQDQGCC